MLVLTPKPVFAVILQFFRHLQYYGAKCTLSVTIIEDEEEQMQIGVER